MKAEDTVVPVGRHNESVSCPRCGEEFGIESKVEYEREFQAEISFKAGVTEVVKFCKENQLPDDPNSCPYPGLVIISKERFQAKLKEWGISQPSPEPRKGEREQ